MSIGGGGIILAKGGQALMTCCVCKRPTTPEHLAPTGPREGLCADCWRRAGDLRGWWRQPAMGNSGVPVLDVLRVLIGRQAGRGQDANEVRTLLRVLDERERLGALTDDGDLPWVCCYCGEREEAKDEGLVRVEAEQHLPVIWHCEDFQACDDRTYKRLLLMIAEAIQEARAAAGVQAQ